MSSLSQRSFAGGEIAPALRGRADTVKYATGLTTCKNFYVRKAGGVSSRAGTRFVGECPIPGVAVRLEPFVFSSSQVYTVEFGRQYIRLIFQGAYVTEAAKNVTAITKASPAVLTSASHGYSNGDYVIISGIGGMVELQNRHAAVSGATTNTINLIDMDSQNIDSSSYTTYTSGGTVARIVELTTSYSESDLDQLVFAQSADVMTVAHPSYDTYELARVSHTSWTFTARTYAPGPGQPTAVTVGDQPTSGDVKHHYYRVTGVDAVGDESYPSSAVGVDVIDNDFDALSEQNSLLDAGGGAYGVALDGVATVQGDLERVISGATKANPCVITATGHGFSDGDEVRIFGVVGMTELNNRSFTVANKTANTFELSGVNSTSYTTYTSDGIAKGPADIAITGVTRANPCVITAPNHNLRNGSIILISGVSGMTELNDNYYAVVAVSSSTINIRDAATFVDSSLYTTYTSGGIIQSRKFSADYGIRVSITETTGTDSTDDTFYIYGKDMDDAEYSESFSGPPAGGSVTSIAYFKEVADIRSRATSSPSTFKVGIAGVSYYPVDVTCTTGGGASRFRLYRGLNNTRLGFVGESGSTTIRDLGGVPDYLSPPPDSFQMDDFTAFGHYPSCIGYFQQRMILAGQVANPEVVYFSRIGSYSNFGSTFPALDDAAFSFTLSGRHVNRVRHIVDVGRLFLFTDGGEWALLGDSSGVITPAQINPVQVSYNGIGKLAPIVVDNNILFVQARGSVVRSLSVQFESDGYRGSDLSVFATHFFENNTIIDWGYMQSPHSIVWAVRDDGVLLGMTYLPEHQIFAWHQHSFYPTGSTVHSVSALPNPETYADECLVAVTRTLNGRSSTLIERMFGVQSSDILTAFPVDSAVEYDGTNSSAVTMKLTTGTTYVAGQTLTCTASSATFASTDVGNGVHLTASDGTIVRFVIAAYTSTTVVTGTANIDIPADLQNATTTSWRSAVDTISGLYYLEGEDVSVIADGYIVANPLDASLSTITVTNGVVTLPRPYAVVKVGLPMVCDLETLDIDPPDANVGDQWKNVSKVTMSLEKSSSCYVGASDPGGTSVSGLNKLDMTKPEDDTDGYVTLHTDHEYVHIRPEWNSNGRVFVRHIDPLPLSILSITPAVLTAPKGRG